MYLAVLLKKCSTDLAKLLWELHDNKNMVSFLKVCKFHHQNYCKICSLTEKIFKMKDVMPVGNTF